MAIPAAMATDSNLILRPRDLNPYSGLAYFVLPKCLGFGTLALPLRSGMILVFFAVARRLIYLSVFLTYQTIRMLKSAAKPALF
ncbi:hypothetical protein [Steroidobacter cummioxidans]|uniref:hypothetical protein n=1 Tax=Steroidobacter cummioxidans TaxID=1803913 RepID=UPI000E30FB8C|nr:hypothetical protein [Steroidobacter cummioxidans]